jgi:hypothetical protein
MKHPLLFAFPFVLGLLLFLGAQTSGCNGGIDDSGADAGADVAVDDDSGQDGALPPALPDDSSVLSCNVNAGEDFIDFCFQKQVLTTEHAFFSPDAGIASSWNATTGNVNKDGGVVVHDFHDDVAYGSSLSMYAISAQTYGDSQIAATVVTPDLNALAPLVEAELATLPASYEGELYMRLRRLAQGLNFIQDTTDGAKVDAIAEAYGRAIYATYFHALTPEAGDAGSDGGGEDGGGEDAGEDAGIAAPLGDGILGVPVGDGGIQYDVDQAASGALALVDLASRHQTDDPTDSAKWARGAGSVFSHLYARARHVSGLYYADLVTSSDPGHDALASVVTPNDALLSETQASVAVSLMRASAIVQNSTLLALSSFPFTSQVGSPLSGMAGVAPDGGAGLSLWDPTPTADTTNACALLSGDAALACTGSGFFIRYVPGTGLDNSAKTLRANALAFEAIHRTLLVGSAAGIDYEPLTALFESQQGVNASFISAAFDQTAYPPEVAANLTILGGSFTVQADAYAIEALTEQWVGQQDCPTQFF